MKYICLGYFEEKMWDAMSEREQKSFVDKCFAYDAELRKGGHFVGGEALQGVKTATTIRHSNGKPVITDGPFAETKEQLGGIMILEAGDLNHAIQLMSNHPSTRMGGTWEIRPSDEQINALFQKQYPGSNGASLEKQR
ncbi:MAG TPA: YciI family protein [Bacteroidota bacterium]|nr:YciI family protein [Bacteroidota bacterium]